MSRPFEQRPKNTQQRAQPGSGAHRRARDASAQYYFTAGGLLHTLNLGVGNVFNTEYRDHLSRVRIIMPASPVATSGCSTGCIFSTALGNSRKCPFGPRILRTPLRFHTAKGGYSIP